MSKRMNLMRLTYRTLWLLILSRNEVSLVFAESVKKFCVCYGESFSPNSLCTGSNYVANVTRSRAAYHVDALAVINSMCDRHVCPVTNCYGTDNHLSLYSLNGCIERNENTCTVPGLGGIVCPFNSFTNYVEVEYVCRPAPTTTTPATTQATTITGKPPAITRSSSDIPSSFSSQSRQSSTENVTDDSAQSTSTALIAGVVCGVLAFIVLVVIAAVLSIVFCRIKRSKGQGSKRNADREGTSTSFPGLQMDRDLPKKEAIPSLPGSASEQGNGVFYAELQPQANNFYHNESATRKPVGDYGEILSA